MDGNAEEARKKRDCTDVVEDAQDSVEEKVKKLRSKISPNENQVEPSGSTLEEETPPKASPTTKVVVKIKEPATKGKVWDLEGAFHYVVRMGDCDDKEFLSEDQSKWVTFRAGHTGDVSSLASLYRKSIIEPPCSPDKETSPEKKVASIPDDTPLEVWLADGLGDEDTPPSFFALLAEISVEDSPRVSQLGAAALLTLAWEDSSRVLRVEWMYVDNETKVASLLERRLWLRLSAISLLSSCELLVVSKDISPSRVGEQQRTNNS
jgi:hypothetical protein